MCSEQFEKAYDSQVDTDVRYLKHLGELEYNFQQMTQSVADERHKEFEQLKDQIAFTLESNDLYEREEATRRQLLEQVNLLKAQCKQEVESRTVADGEIESALSKYQEIIETAVTKQREEIRDKQKAHF